MSNALNRFLAGNQLDALKTKLAQPPQAAAGVSAAHRIPLALIDEDPDQPRRHFDKGDLRMLADSIALAGLLQAVTVRPAPHGRYLLRYGARRLRACKLLGWADIPAVVRDDTRDDGDAQAIENQHRAGLADSELGAHADAMAGRGMTAEQIATVLNLRDPQSVRYYRAISRVREVPELADWIDKAPARALYEAYAAWAKAGEEQRRAIAAMLAECQDLSVTVARRIIAAAKMPEAATEMPAVSEVPQADPTVRSEYAGSAEEEADTAPVHAADTIAPEPVAAVSRPARHRSAAPPPAPSEDERERRVRAWLASPQRPRPPLTV